MTLEPPTVDEQDRVPAAPAAEVSDEPAKSGGRPSQATQLVELASDVDLWHDADGAAWATIPAGDGHVEHHQLRTKGFRTWLRGRFYDVHKKAPGSQGIQDAIEVLDARACFDGDEYAAHVRVAGNGDAVYLDLADDEWRIIEVTADGWQPVSSADAPVRFRRRGGMQPLPTPTAGGTLDALRDFVNVTDDDWALVKAWLVAAVRPSGPYPLLPFIGEQGTAKSTSCRALRRVIDPNQADLRRTPRDERDLILAATNARVVAFDNLSGIQGWLSDALAALATGSGFATRALYSNDEEAIFAACRPIVLNGITDVVSRADLLDRSLIIEPPRISVSQRRTERELWAAFGDAHPAILGALLDAVSCALRRVDRVKLDRLPRMADFARWATSAEPALGLDDGQLMKVYDRNRDDAQEIALESSPIAVAIRDLVNRVGDWSGAAGELLTLISPEHPPKHWPSSGQAMAGELRRAAPVLRSQGIDLDYVKNRRRWTITRTGDGTTAQTAQGAQTDGNPQVSGPFDSAHSGAHLPGESAHFIESAQTSAHPKTVLTSDDAHLRTLRTSDATRSSGNRGARRLDIRSTVESGPCDGCGRDTHGMTGGRRLHPGCAPEALDMEAE